MYGNRYKKFLIKKKKSKLREANLIFIKQTLINDRMFPNDIFQKVVSVPNLYSCHLFLNLEMIKYRKKHTKQEFKKSCKFNILN